MIDSMKICSVCGNISIIQVATSNGISFYSCITEGCEMEAQLLVNIGDWELVKYEKVYDTFKEIVNNEHTDKTKDSKSQS
jgi:hypothetical protein